MLATCSCGEQEAHAFVELLLKLVELTLLQTNVEVDQVLSRGWADPRPLGRDVVRVLDRVGMVGVERSGNATAGSTKDCEQDRGSSDRHGEGSTAGLTDVGGDVEGKVRREEQLPVEH